MENSFFTFMFLISFVYQDTYFTVVSSVCVRRRKKDPEDNLYWDPNSLSTALERRKKLQSTHLTNILKKQVPGLLFSCPLELVVRLQCTLRDGRVEVANDSFNIKGVILAE